MATFYLVCFVIGFAFSVLSLLMGSARLHLHLPHHGLPHSGGLGHAAAPHGAGTAQGGHAGHLSPDHGLTSGVSFFNFFTFMAFLAWFGGTGYLMTQYSSLWFVLGLAIASAAGLAGAGIVFWFMAKVLLAREKTLDPSDYELIGVLGRVSSSIRVGGTGEIIFSQEGTRRTSGARSEDGAAIAKGTEVVITRYERGIAYVRRWEELTHSPA